MQLYKREGAEAQDCAESNRPIQRADSGNHGKEQGEEHGEGDGGTGPVCARLARLFRLLRNPFGVAGFGFVDQEARTVRLLATVEDRPPAVCGTGPAGCEQGVGGKNRRLALRPVACEPEPGSGPSPVECLSHVVWTSVLGRGSKRITNRTAVYGPVPTVVWEGRRSDPPPYPDQECLRHGANPAARTGTTSDSPGPSAPVC